MGVAQTDVEETVTAGHPERRRNHRTADWLVTGPRLVVAYDHPFRGDSTTARIVTLWRRR